MSPEKYPRTYHFPFSEGAVNDDKICQHWAPILSQELVITEKLDGENTCIKSTGVFARSHGAVNRNPWAKPIWDIWSRIGTSLGNFHVFGENLYAIHSIEYERLPAWFFVFAMREGERWLSWDEVTEWATILELPLVPVLFRGHLTEKELVSTIITQQQTGSAFGGTSEGVVCRTAVAFDDALFSQNVLKFVRKNHVQTDEHWTKNWKRAPLWYENADFNEGTGLE